jgi:enoyl-CoA hydratase/carnithine racemase
MAEEKVLVAGEGNISTVTVNRPDKLNCIDWEVARSLREAFEELRRYEELRAVILTGSGEKAFVGGVDVNIFLEFTPHKVREFITLLHSCMAAIRELPVPVIAAVNGYALGGGCELAAACDMRIAADNAMFGMPEVKLGLPSVIEGALLPRLVGAGKAAELVLMGEMIDAQEAHRIGLANRVVPSDRLMEEARGAVEVIAANGPLAIRLQKELINVWMQGDLKTAVEAGINAFAYCFTSSQPGEGAAAFLEKRVPEW